MYVVLVGVECLGELSYIRSVKDLIKYHVMNIKFGDIVFYIHIRVSLIT